MERKPYKRARRRCKKALKLFQANNFLAVTNCQTSYSYYFSKRFCFQFQKRSEYVKLMFCVMTSHTKSVMSCVYEYYPYQGGYMDQCIANEKRQPSLLYKESSQNKTKNYFIFLSEFNQNYGVQDFF